MCSTSRIRFVGIAFDLEIGAAERRAREPNGIRVDAVKELVDAESDSHAHAFVVLKSEHLSCIAAFSGEIHTISGAILGPEHDARFPPFRYAIYSKAPIIVDRACRIMLYIDHVLPQPLVNLVVLRSHIGDRNELEVRILVSRIDE